MDVFLLRVDLPHERAGRPGRADEGVFAAHEVQVRAPEQAIEIRLGHEGQARQQGEAGRGARGFEAGGHALGNQQHAGLRVGRQRLDQRINRRRGIAKQGHRAGTVAATQQQGFVHAQRSQKRVLLVHGRLQGVAFGIQPGFAQQAAPRLAAATAGRGSFPPRPRHSDIPD
ncbi:hypothetical protein G6F31_019491 [Rhizopus arrhizus]|nr:hypothetical protein G6F31_019491 [Rhizopus arrhizus]